MWGESKSNFKMKPVVSFIDSLQGKEEERWTVEAEKKHFSSRFVEREYRENKMRKEIRKKVFFFYFQQCSAHQFEATAAVQQQATLFL